jgi:hypothetical protein
VASHQRSIGDFEQLCEFIDRTRFDLHSGQDRKHPGFLPIITGSSLPEPALNEASPQPATRMRDTDRPWPLR